MTKKELFELAKLMTKAINSGQWDIMSKSVAYGDALDNRVSAPRMAASLLGWITYDCIEDYEKWVQNGLDPDIRNNRAGV